MFAQLKLYALAAVAVTMCGLVVACSLMYAHMSAQSDRIASLTAKVEQQERDAKALNEALSARDQALADAEAKSKAVRSVIAPLRNTAADPDISPIMKRYLEEIAK